MNSRSLLLLVLVASLTFPLLKVLADPPVTFDLLTNVDYPGGTETYASGVNDRGDVTGRFTRDSHPPRGYVLFANGTFSQPISNPDAYLGTAFPNGINNARTLCGYFNGTNGDHGFVYSQGVFTDILVDRLNTYVMKVNDAGHFCGYTSNGLANAFVNLDGVLTHFSVPGSNQTWANGINNLDQVVGSYTVSGDGAIHGYRRDADGTFSYPIDGPVAEDTFLFAINDKGQMTGSVIVDNGTAGHAIFFPSPNQFAVYDHPDATIYTDFEGINNKGQICGRYFDGTVNHGFVVKVRPATGE
jgi:uncharacterized membrane protein